MPNDIGGDVLVGTCACEEDPWVWYGSPTGGFWSKPLWCWQAHRLPRFCQDCGSELRAYGTAKTRVDLPDAGEPRAYPNATPRYVSWYNDGHGWSVSVCEQRNGTVRVVARVNAQDLDNPLALAAALLAAERKRREWADEKEASIGEADEA